MMRVVAQGLVSDRTDWAPLASVLGVLAVAEAGVAVVAGAGSGVGWARLLDLFVVTNAAIGLSLALAGWLIAHYRPRNAVG